MEFGLPSVSPLSVCCFLAGASIAWTGVTWVLSVRRRGRLCPRCHSTTIPLVPTFPLKLFGRGVTSRWCPGCGWEGIALRPAHERRSRTGKIRLRGGFRWGFRHPPPPGAFSWRGVPQDPGEVPAPPDAWGRRRGEPQERRGAPGPYPSFGGSPPHAGGKERMEENPPPIRPRLGFRWKR